MCVDDSRRNSNFVLTLLWMASVQLMAFLSMSVITFTFRCRINKKDPFKIYYIIPLVETNDDREKIIILFIFSFLYSCLVRLGLQSTKQVLIRCLCLGFLLNQRKFVMEWDGIAKVMLYAKH